MFDILDRLLQIIQQLQAAGVVHRSPLPPSPPQSLPAGTMQAFTSLHLCLHIESICCARDAWAHPCNVHDCKDAHDLSRILATRRAAHHLLFALISVFRYAKLRPR
jgi:hypothetical protein